MSHVALISRTPLRVVRVLQYQDGVPVKFARYMPRPMKQSDHDDDNSASPESRASTCLLTIFDSQENLPSGDKA